MGQNNKRIEEAASKEAITAKKELFSEEAIFVLFVLGLQMLCIWGFMSGANWAAEEEQLMDAYIFEQGQELGYNWTEQNMTVFETMTSTGTFSSAPMHEVMCSNGVEEGCDYMIVANTADRLYKMTFMQHGFVSVAIVVQALLVFFWPIAIKDYFY